MRKGIPKAPVTGHRLIDTFEKKGTLQNSIVLKCHNSPCTHKRDSLPVSKDDISGDMGLTHSALCLVFACSKRRQQQDIQVLKYGHAVHSGSQTWS